MERRKYRTPAGPIHNNRIGKQGKTYDRGCTWRKKIMLFVGIEFYGFLLWVENVGWFINELPLKLKT